MEFWIVLVALMVLGPIFGWISFFKIKKLEKQIVQVKVELNLVRRAMGDSRQATKQTEPDPTAETEVKETPPDADTDIKPTVPNEWLSPEPALKQEEPETPEEPATQEAPVKPIPIPPRAQTSESPAITESNSQVIDPTYVFEKFKENWMLWIGGLSVALAGIFLARYAIQQGVLGPTGRIIAGIITGLALHAAAEYFRRRLNENHPSFAMLAAGGSITLFATLLAALHYYQMFSPTLVFVVLAAVALATMWLALIHGPILAAAGMIGAYILPIMVSTGQGDVLVALTYSLIITTSILLLMQFVSRYWLWTGMLAGSLFWWLASLDTADGHLWRLWYLAALAYLMLATMTKDWQLNARFSFQSSDRFYSLRSKTLSPPYHWIIPSILVVVLAQQFSVFIEYSYQIYALAWIPLSVIIMRAARRNAFLSLPAWLTMTGLLAMLLLSRFDDSARSLINPIALSHSSAFLTTMSFVVLIFSGLAWFNSRTSDLKSCWTSMTLITPILVLIVSHLCYPDLLSIEYWSLSTLVVGALYIFLGTMARSKQWHQDWEVWLYLSGHFAYAFAAVLFFDNGTLTLALALQAISLALIIKRYDLPQLSWLLKWVVTGVVLRLTLNPWLADYPTEQHWTLWTYGGSFIAVAIASYLLTKYETLRRWTEGAAMHLLVLALWVECRYYLYDGVVFQHQYSLAEASLTTMIFGLLSLVYYHRASLGHYSKKIYETYSYLLMLAAITNYMIIVAQTLSKDPAVWRDIGTTPLWNIMLLTYGFPVLLGYLSMKYFAPKYARSFEYFSGISAFIFINLEIRHLWQGSLNLNLPTSDGEIYTYSIFWLVASLAMVFLGSFKLGRRYYKAGLAMLALVVVKVFIFDMSQLDGVYRILAFMGLGLSLLGMAYIHKKLIAILEHREALTN